MRSGRIFGGPEDERFHVLFVCTGNICRSPTAEAIALRELARYHGVPLAFASAGSHAMEGRPATRQAVAAATARGADLGQHRARELTRARVGQAGLVLCMAAEHRPFVLAYERTAARRTFLLASFVRAVGGLPAASPAELVELAAKEAYEDPGDDIDDPIGRGDAVYAAVAERLDSLVIQLVAVLAESAASRQPGGP